MKFMGVPNDHVESVEKWLEIEADGWTLHLQDPTPQRVWISVPPHKIWIEPQQFTT